MTGVHVYNTAVSRRQYTKQANQSTCERISQGVAIHALSTLDSLSANRLSVYLQSELSLLSTAAGPSARWVSADLDSLPMLPHDAFQQFDSIGSYHGHGVLGVPAVSSPRVGRQNTVFTASRFRISGVSWVSRLKSKLSRVRACAHTRTCAPNRFVNRQDSRDTPLTAPGRDSKNVENRRLVCPPWGEDTAGHPGTPGGVGQ